MGHDLRIQDRLAAEPPVHDLVGIGFGPSNLALAACLQECRDDGAPPVSSLFLEAKPSYVWHPGMLLGGALVQLSFLKDLATLRNPQSRFTFLNYLRHRGRLDKFINLRNFYPTRLEFNDYFAWVAEEVRDQVRYGREVIAVHPVAASEGGIEAVRVTARNVATGEVEEHLGRNLVVATGGTPSIPKGVDLPLGDRIVHSHHFLDRVRDRFPDPHGRYRILVVGSGQSAAEIFQYLITHYPEAEVTAALRRFAYKPADNSDFVNEIFFPHMVEFLYGLSETKRRSILREHQDTNYSAVDIELIQAIYRELYARSIAGDHRATVRPFLELTSLKEGERGVIAELYNSAHDRPEFLEADGVVLATGYRRDRRLALLDELDPWLLSDGSGGYRVARDYRVVTKPDFAPEVFLQGFCEDTHGLSDTLLSVLPLRSQEICRVLLAAQEAAELDQAEAV
jgi:L-ornithine N5-monooxygenase